MIFRIAAAIIYNIATILEIVMTIFRILMAAFENVAAIKINVYRPSNDDLGSASDIPVVLH
jgi:hypothetical protein